MDATRRQFLTATATATLPLAGCVEGELADTTYDCEVGEPTSKPIPSRPTIGDSTAPVTVEIYHDYSERVSSIFAEEVLSRLLTRKADSGDAKFEFYDLPAPGDEDWAYQLASVGRYLFTEYGSGAFREFLFKMYDHQADPSWQVVGDIADSVGSDPCTVISHGSWKTYEQESITDKQDALAQGIDEIPAVVVDGERLHGLAPIRRSYQQITDAIGRKQNME